MSGFIIPDPLAIPVMDTCLPPISSCTDTSLGRVSVVKIPSAASTQEDSDKSAKTVGAAARIFSTGKCSPITPVENGSTSCTDTPAKSAIF